MAGKYEFKKSADGQFMFNLHAGNGEAILTSERYKAKASALNGIDSVRANSSDDKQYRRLEAANGSPYFLLTAANGETIGRSEMYSSPAARDKGIESVKVNGPTATLDVQA